MSGLFDRWWRDRRGVTAVEFAFMLPLLILVFLTLVELGRGMYQATAVEKGLRAGALYAARAPYPLSAGDTTFVTNLAKTGTLDGSAPYLAPGWADAAASLDIAAEDYDLSGDPVPVYRLTAQVPFESLFPGLMTMTGLADSLTLQLAHEQAYVGD